MQLSALLRSPGEHKLELTGNAGRIEACLMVPDTDTAQANKIAIVGHPHSLKGGAMQNKVVTTMARTFKAAGIPSLRFNFRGVGASEGEFDDGIGESEDMLKVAKQIQTEMPGVELIFAGFSFGSFVAYRTASQCEHTLLITIAPPVQNFDYTVFPIDPSPWVLVQGDEDDVVPPKLVFEFAEARDIQLIKFEKTEHFFHGKLTDLKEKLLEVLTT